MDAVYVENLRKSFGDVQALQGVNLRVERGTVHALLGPNGAGKTTLVRILTTLIKPTSGVAQIFGYAVTEYANFLRTIFGLAGQFAVVDGNLTGRENLELIGKLHHLKKNDLNARVRRLLERFELTDSENRLAKTFSGGMRRRLDLASSLIGKPHLLFLDEPTTGLDPHGRNALWNVVRELVNDGTTVLLTTQYLEEADQFANAITVIDKGLVIAEGTADQLKTKVGGNVLEIIVADKTAATSAAQALLQLGRGQPYIEAEHGKITLPVYDDKTVLMDAVRLLDNSGIEVSSFALHRPSLDDVFLSLTGHTATQ